MTVLLNKPVVTSMLLPNLMKPLMVNNSFPTVVDKMLFDEISEIAVCGDGFAYTTVVDFLLNEYFSVALNPGLEEDLELVNGGKAFVWFFIFLTHFSLTLL